MCFLLANEFNREIGTFYPNITVVCSDECLINDTISYCQNITERYTSEEVAIDFLLWRSVL